MSKMEKVYVSVFGAAVLIGAAVLLRLLTGGEMPVESQFLIYGALAVILTANIASYLTYALYHRQHYGSAARPVKKILMLLFAAVNAVLIIAYAVSVFFIYIAF